MKKLVIIGASGHGKVIADMALRCGYDEVLFLDDNPAVKMVGSFKVVGSSSLASELAEQGYDFVVGIGNADIRERIQEDLIAKGCNVVSLLHPNAVVAYDAVIGCGSAVMAGAVVGEGVCIGKGCIVNTSAVVGCDNVIGDYAHISVGAVLGNNVSVTGKSWIGIGAKVVDNVTISCPVTVGAGGCVDRDLSEEGVYVGVNVGKAPVRAEI